MARSKGFSLIEVLISAAILSAMLVFIFRSFSSLISSARLAQDISRGCYFTEEKIFEIEQARFKGLGLPETDEELIKNTNFSWSYEVLDISNEDVEELRFKVIWGREAGRSRYQMEFCVYLPKTEDELQNITQIL